MSKKEFRQLTVELRKLIDSSDDFSFAISLLIQKGNGIKYRQEYMDRRIFEVICSAYEDLGPLPKWVIDGLREYDRQMLDDQGEGNHAVPTPHPRLQELTEYM